MSSHYEFRINCPDRKKLINCGHNYEAWAEIYNAAAAVDGEEPDQFKEEGNTIGEINTNMPYLKAVEQMINEAFLHNKLAAILRSDEEVSEYKEK